MKLCEECGEPGGRMNDVHGIRLCSECVKLDEYYTLCKTDAKNDYFLTEKDLKECECTRVKKHGYSTYLALYIKKDIIDLFCQKYFLNPLDTEGIEAMQAELEEKRDEARSKRQKTSEKRKKSRKKKLVRALGEKGLRLRPDSKLCHGYIEGKIVDKSVDEIVERMCQMKYLYDYCHMEKCYKKARRLQDEELEAGYIPDIPLVEEAERIALKKYAPKRKYPSRWPWLEI